MTTARNEAIVVEASGFVRVCAWCVPAIRLAEIHKAHLCTDGLCLSCATKLQEQG